MAIFQVRRFVFSVYVFECFILAELYKLVVKAVWKACLQAGFSGNLYKEQRLLKHAKGFMGFCYFFTHQY